MHIQNDNGFVLAYRSAWSHPAFKDLREAAIWNFLYQNAFWKDGERHFNGHTFQLKRGQIVVSVSFLAKGFGMTEKGVRVVIQKLEKLGMLGIQGANRGSIITICNYDKFQSFGQTEGEQEGKQRANRGQTEGENKKQITNKTKKERNNIPDKPDYIPDQLWDDFLKIRKSKKSPLTETALNGIMKQADKAGWTLEQVLTECCERSWQSFKADWVKNTKGNANARSITTGGQIVTRRNSGYSLEDVHAQAMGDVYRTEGREERLARLGIGDSTSKE